MAAINTPTGYNPLTGGNNNVAPAPTGGLSAPNNGYNPLTGDTSFMGGGARFSAPSMPNNASAAPQPSATMPSNVPGAPTAGQVPPAASSGGAFNPQYQQNSGYNPLQYATLDTANQLANNFGANVIQTRGVGHLAPPPQNMLDMGGGQVFNAGLVAQNVARYGEAAARRMMEAEMNLPGAYNPNWQNDDSVFNLNNREGMFQNVSGGAQARGSGYSGPTNNAASPVTGSPARPTTPATPATPTTGTAPGQPTPYGGTPYPSPYPAPRLQDPRFVGGGMGTFSNFANQNNFAGGGARGRGGSQVNIQSLLQALLGLDMGAGGRQQLLPGERTLSPIRSASINPLSASLQNTNSGGNMDILSLLSLLLR